MMEAVDYGSEDLRDEIEKIRLMTEAKDHAKAIKPLIDGILGRDFHYGNGRSSNEYPSWDVDMYRADTHGKKGDYSVDEKYDALWDAYLSGKESIHGWVQESIYDFVGDKRQRSWNWGEGLTGLEDRVYDYTLWHTDNERMILVSFDGDPVDLLRFEEIGCAVEAVLKAVPDDGTSPSLNMELSDAQDYFDLVGGTGVEALKQLTIFCNSLDKFDASCSASYEYNYQRSEAEREWDKGDFSVFDNADLEDFLDDPDISRSVKRKIHEYLK